jgi:HSP20 family molecular chaperone IbpA
MAHKHVNRGRRRDVYELVKDVVGPMEAFLDKPWSRLGESRAARVEVEETPKEILITAKLPGLARGGLKTAELRATIKDDILEIRLPRAHARPGR